MKNTSLLKKAVTSVMAGLIAAADLLLLGNSGSIAWFPPQVVFSLVGLALLLSLIFPFIWQYKQNSGGWDNSKIYLSLYNFIRIGIAFNLATFAFKKFFGIQLSAAKDISDVPINQQSGETLTWYYFSYSHAFAMILACLQLLGALLLLFRRTLLLASVVLFSLMLNICLINIFYHLNLGALVQSLIVTAGVLFILLLHYKRLLVFFIKPQPYSFSPTASTSVNKNLIRFSMIAFALIYSYYLASV